MRRATDIVLICVLINCLERDIFNRENASGMYRPSMFYWGRTLAEMPQHIILMGIMATIAYWMYGLQADFEKFMIFLILIARFHDYIYYTI